MRRSTHELAVASQEWMCLFYLFESSQYCKENVNGNLLTFS
jgi:hypothetical protein